MNNSVLAAIQRHFEARRLLRMGGPKRSGRALEVGCGRGVGTDLILQRFGADSVDAFDFGIIHHVPDWRRALAEVHRALKPTGA